MNGSAMTTAGDTYISLPALTSMPAMTTGFTTNRLNPARSLSASERSREVVPGNTNPLGSTMRSINRDCDPTKNSARTPKLPQTWEFGKQTFTAGSTFRAWTLVDSSYDDCKYEPSNNKALGELPVNIDVRCAYPALRLSDTTEDLQYSPANWNRNEDPLPRSKDVHTISGNPSRA